MKGGGEVGLEQRGEGSGGRGQVQGAGDSSPPFTPPPPSHQLHCPPLPSSLSSLPTLIPSLPLHPSNRYMVMALQFEGSAKLPPEWDDRTTALSTSLHPSPPLPSLLLSSPLPFLPLLPFHSYPHPLAPPPLSPSMPTGTWSWPFSSRAQQSCPLNGMIAPLPSALSLTATTTHSSWRSR